MVFILKAPKIYDTPFTMVYHWCTMRDLIRASTMNHFKEIAASILYLLHTHTFWNPRITTGIPEWKEIFLLTCKRKYSV